MEFCQRLSREPDLHASQQRRRNALEARTECNDALMLYASNIATMQINELNKHASFISKRRQLVNRLGGADTAKD